MVLWEGGRIDMNILVDDYKTKVSEKGHYVILEDYDPLEDVTHYVIARQSRGNYFEKYRFDSYEEAKTVFWRM